MVESNVANGSHYRVHALIGCRHCRDEIFVSDLTCGEEQSPKLKVARKDLRESRVCYAAIPHPDTCLGGMGRKMKISILGLSEETDQMGQLIL